MTLTDAAVVYDSLATKARHGDVGQAKPYREAFTGFDYHRDSQEWRQVSRVVDRENNRCTERIVDASGDVVRDVDGPLNDHLGHGATKRANPRS